MHFRKSKSMKKLGAIAIVAMLSTASMSTTALANSQLYESKEGVGIEVNNPMQEGIAPLSIIDSDPSNVLGGKLWTTWKNGHSFRANYDHSSKTHRCTAQNGDGTSSRSAWEPK